MNRSDIIAHVLVRSQLYSSLPEAKAMIIETFEKDFPDRDYHAWDQPVVDETADALVRTIGIKTMQTLSLRHFILDLEKITSV
jgi:hypothetical protein